jgi:hypothetical protein
MALLHTALLYTSRHGTQERCSLSRYGVCVSAIKGAGGIDWTTVDLKSQEDRDVKRQFRWSALVCCRFSLPVIAAMVRLLSCVWQVRSRVITHAHALHDLPPPPAVVPLSLRS